MNTTSPVPYLDLDGIDLEKRIARGTFPVYKATMEGQVIAVKRMDCDKNELPHEVQVHNNLPPHPNVLSLLGVTHSKDGFDIYICMPLAGKSLDQIARGMHHLQYKYPPPL